MREWPQDFDRVRAAAERRLEKSVESLNNDERRRLIAAVREYGSIENIPPAVWDDIEREAYLALLPLLWSVSVEAADVVLQSLDSGRAPEAVQAATQQRADAQAKRIASASTAALRKRVQRFNLPPAPVSVLSVPPSVPPGIVRPNAPAPTPDPTQFTTMSDLELRRWALDAIRKATELEKAKLADIAGQYAAEAIGDGARGGGEIYQAENPHHTVTLIWRVRKTNGTNAPGLPQDDRVCPICAPLEGLPESIWAEYVLGVPAHWGCRCEYQIFVTLGRFGTGLR